jgi:ectoine hydroxylase-related dioxygenase (phytanoyl-CoA dioxygenase family)
VRVFFKKIPKEKGCSEGTEVREWSVVCMETPRVFTKGEPAEYLKHLDERGYVVIGDILNDTVRSDLVEKFWKCWTECSPGFDRYDKTTWTIQNSPMMFAKGMAVFSGLAHSDFVWETRLQPSIREVFEQIHGTSNLVTSFDGFSVFFTRLQKTPSWLHTDQHPENTEYCVQGAYNFLPVTQKSAGFIVVPGSHKETRVATKKGDWVPVENDPRAVKLLIPENCLVLWNSKTVHANTGMTSSEVKLDRLTCYITYLPKSTRPHAVLVQKIIAYLKSDGTSHWANRCEVKKYPWGFGPNYEKKGFQRVKTTREIPAARLSFF